MFQFNQYEETSLKDTHFEFVDEEGGIKTPYPKRYRALVVNGYEKDVVVKKIKVASFDNEEDYLALGTVDRFLINGSSYNNIEDCLKSLSSLLFNKGRADGGNGGSEDSTLQQITTNGNTTNKELVVQGATLGADENGNLKLGKSALSKLADIGVNLTAIGVNALALYDGSQGSYKESIVALGNTAGANLKGGGYAVILGTQAAASLISTFVDVIIGSDAAKRATTSNGYNVAIGHGVAQKATILTDETIIGGTAMNKYMGESYKTTNDPTGETELQSGGNISIGKWSLYSMLYGRENIAIGNECGRCFLNYGEYNIFLGPGITKDYRQVYGNSSVVIGAYAPIPENFNLSYKLIVHARRPEDPWVFPLIYGDFKERWLKLSGNLILPPEYTPDADKEPAEGEEAFVPTKIMVADDTGKVGIMSFAKLKELINQ